MHKSITTKYSGEQYVMQSCIYCDICILDFSKFHNLLFPQDFKNK